LGDTGSRTIYYYFQMRTSLKIEDAVERPEALVSFLRDMFKTGLRSLRGRSLRSSALASELTREKSEAQTWPPL
jgi:hypothetical protein